MQVKAISIKSDDLPAQEDHESSPLYRQEKFIYYYKDSENAKNKEMYRNFMSDFSIFLVKLASSPLKKWATVAYDKDSILIGYQINGQQIGLVDKVAVKNGKVIALVVDAASIGLEVDKDNLTAESIDKAVYTVYHAMLRAAINEGFLKLRKNTDIVDALTEWYHTAFLRSLNLPTLDDLAFAKFDFVIAYFINRYMMMQNHRMSFANAQDYIKRVYSDVSENALSDADISEEAFKATKDMREFTKMFKVLEITSDDTMKQIQQILKKIGTVGFITVTGPADYAIAGIIMALYAKEYSSLLMNSRQQSNLESLIDPYLKTLKFGSM